MQDLFSKHSTYLYNLIRSQEACNNTKQDVPKTKEIFVNNSKMIVMCRCQAY